MKKFSKPLMIIIAIIIIIVIAAIVYYFTKPKSTPGTPEQKNNSGSGTPSPSNTGSPSADAEFPLKHGMMNNENVRNVQGALNLFKGENLDPDGDFGDLTRDALKAHYGITSVSYANYNSFVKPHLAEIKNYLDSHK